MFKSFMTVSPISCFFYLLQIPVNFVNM